MPAASVGTGYAAENGADFKNDVESADERVEVGYEIPSRIGCRKCGTAWEIFKILIWSLSYLIWPLLSLSLCSDKLTSKIVRRI